MSSSESSDDDTERLKEAIDPEFINDGLFDNSKKKPEERKKLGSESRTSLNVTKKSYSEKRDGLNVTPEFQNFVAKHLSAMLEKEIEEVCSSSKKKKKHTKGGVRLLGSSSVFLSCDEDNEHFESLPRERMFMVKSKSVPDDIDEKDKVTEAAVSYDWLTKESTKGWEKSTKGKVLIVKNNVCVDA